MRTKKILAISLIMMMLGCELENDFNPNSPTLQEIIANPNKSNLNALVTGTLSAMRGGYATYVVTSGTLIRELYLFDADPRNLIDLVGRSENKKLDNSAFYTTRVWSGRYRTIKNCNILMEAVRNAKDNILSAAEKKGYYGFAKTIIAHQFILLYAAYFDEGIRLDVKNPDKLGDRITDTSVVLNHILTLLDDAYNDLTTGTAFAFSLTSGFEGFNTPATFAKFNRALGARVALYAKDNQKVLSMLSDSFFDLQGDFSIGPKMVYSTGNADILNRLFKTPQQSGDQIIVSDFWVDNADQGDSRVKNKVALRKKPTSRAGISGKYETRLYPTSSSPIDIIRNEELIFIYAEAKMDADNPEALRAINIIRSAYNLSSLAGPLTIKNILKERQYSFWGEAQRMVDLRRTGIVVDTTIMDTTIIKPDPIVIDGKKQKQVVFSKLPLPLSEEAAAK